MLIHLLKVLWVRWKAFGHKLATIQSRALLFVFYYFVLGPFAVGMRALSDPLQLRPGTPGGWLPRSSPGSGTTTGADTTMLARRQF